MKKTTLILIAVIVILLLIYINYVSIHFLVENLFYGNTIINMTSLQKKGVELSEVMEVIFISKIFNLSLLGITFVSTLYFYRKSSKLKQQINTFKNEIK